MQPPARLAADLALLSAALDDPTADLAGVLDGLAAAARAAVSGYRGLRLTVVVDGLPATLAVLEPDDSARDAVSSVALPLALCTDAEAGSLLVLFSSSAGAFVDLVADVSWATATSAAAYVLDEHQHLMHTDGAALSVRDFATVQQAVGVLLDRGLPPEEAWDRLRGLAAAAGVSLAVAGRRILARVAPAPLDGGGARREADGDNAAGDR